MKQCPFCAEEIQEAANKCRYCGSLLNESAAPAADRAAPDSIDRTSASQFSAPRVLGLIGSVVLFLGVFAPMISAPIVGNFNFFQNGRGDGVVIIILSALSLAFTLTSRYRALWATGLCSLVVLLLTFATFQLKFSEMTHKVNSDLSDNPFKGLADVAVQSVQLQWGWAVLVVGAGLLIGAAALSPAKLMPKQKLALGIGAGLIVTAAVVNYVTDDYLVLLFAALMQS